MRETKTLEFKEAITNSFLKTVSAFANYSGGSILFGVDDSGTVVGIDNPIEICLDIENKINDTITPQPEYSLEVHGKNSTIELKVKEGHSKPYLYKSKAYKRNDSSTVEVDTTELTRLILEGKNLTFEQLPSKKQSLTFGYLGEAITNRLGLKTFNTDTLKTLGLLSDEHGYANAAAILADKNEFPGIDLAQFGESINVILRRVTIENTCALIVFNEAMHIFEDIYCFEEVSGAIRKSIEKVPREAFREAVANALVHRTWDIPAHIRIAMFADHIDVTSPGGLPTGISEEEYLSDMVSVRRNPALASVFYKLGIIEAFGTGTLRIKAAYANSLSKPRFVIKDNSIMVSLPTLEEDLGLTPDQKLVYELLSPVRPMAGSELASQVSFSRSKLTGILKELITMGLASTSGAGRGLKYRRN